MSERRQIVYFKRTQPKVLAYFLYWKYSSVKTFSKRNTYTPQVESIISDSKPIIVVYEMVPVNQVLLFTLVRQVFLVFTIHLHAFHLPVL